MSIDTIAVRGTSEKDEYSLWWEDEDGEEQYICHVYGFDNAVRVATGIAHKQVEYVKHPCFSMQSS